MSRRGLNLEISWTGKNGVALCWGEGGREGGEAVGAKRERKKREAIGLTIPKRLDGVII